MFYNLSIISSAYAYGGNGDSGSMVSKYRVSYKTFNLCLKDRGYTKDKNGIFEMLNLTCD